MKLLTITRKHDHGNPHIPGHRYKDTWTLEIGWNRIKLNYCQYRKGKGFATWYPFSLYWWPSHNQ